MSVLSRSESPGGGGGGGSFASEGEEDRRAGVVVWMERKGDMRGVPVRVRVDDISPGVVVVMRDARGRMGRETRGTIVRKKGKRGSTRRIMT
jgi:hypothetical protein